MTENVMWWIRDHLGCTHLVCRMCTIRIGPRAFSKRRVPPLSLPACFHCWNLQYKKHTHRHAAHVNARVDNMALIHTSFRTISSYMSRPCTFTVRCVPLREPMRPIVVTTVVAAEETIVWAVTAVAVAVLGGRVSSMMRSVVDFLLAVVVTEASFSGDNGSGSHVSRAVCIHAHGRNPLPETCEQQCTMTGV